MAVFSFMSQISGGSTRDSGTRSPTRQDDTFARIGNVFGARKPRPSSQPQQSQALPTHTSTAEPFPNVSVPSSNAHDEHGSDAVANRNSTPAQGPGRQRSSSRPMSMIQTYQPQLMDTDNAVPELQPIYTLLNSHANKMYQEGYFLKLDDQNTRTTPLSSGKKRHDKILRFTDTLTRL